MTDNARMVDLPWVDGTTRTVPEGTVYEAKDGIMHVALDYVHRSSIAAVAVRIFTEAPEPPVKVNVPTGLGAIVSLSVSPDYPGFVLTRSGWRGLNSYTEYDPSEIATELHDGARVLFEGVDEDTP